MNQHRLPFHSRPPASAAALIVQALFVSLGLEAWLVPSHAAAAVPATDGRASVIQAFELTAGDLRLGLRCATNGVHLTSLFDVRRQRELLATSPLPLFAILLAHIDTHKDARLVADQGWQQTRLRRTRAGCELEWELPEEPSLKDIGVRAAAVADSRSHSWQWNLHVENRSKEWTVSRVVFPQLALARPGAAAAAVFPRGPGEVQTGLWERAFSYRGHYPGGWCAMQFMAAYAEGASPAGLYVGVHDPWGSTKDISLEGDPVGPSARFTFTHPSPELGQAGNDFDLSGEAVWRLLRGDWFDAAMIYKAWAKKEARWWPAAKAGGRHDTPLWTRELNAWAMTGGASGECVPRVKEFREFLGLPVGFHWYHWHQIPFDNDYPHYFPAKDGFAEGVAELKQAGVFVMPYINGRLWDILDRGAEDFEFTRLARPAASKREDGLPFVESYGSKETNGSPVKLAAMCPVTPLWQQTVRQTVLKLLGEVGVNAVYIDQVAAASPTLCMDRAHGHPTGGGHWWNEGYWRMLESIRQTMPPAAMLTTECNGEPFVRWFDGYLTWHWQYNGQVPVFPAIYGGTVQMFGRAYRGGATKDLALRMKAGQQLVFGEQLGWLDPGVVNEKENAEFFRQAVRLRARLSRYFWAGEMARPPKLNGTVPSVKADWQWSGEWWVTTDAVLTGAWRLPDERRLALVCVNVSDDPVTATLPVDPKNYGFAGKKPRVTLLEGGDLQPAAQDWPGCFARPVSFPPRQARAWELEW